MSSSTSSATDPFALTYGAGIQAGKVGDILTRAERVLPGGVSSNVRLSAPRRFFTRGRGARLWDIQGRDYVDYLLGQGPAFLGHAHPLVTAAVTEAVQRGMLFGAQHPLEVEAVEKLLDAVSWADMIRLGLSGTEAVHAAIRIARAATGRRRVVRFSGTYHGWLDTTLMRFSEDGFGPASEGQPAECLADWLILPFNEPDTVAATFVEHGEEIAAVICEPVMCNNGVIGPAPGFLEGLRRHCTTAGAVLIFDEVITGFRLALGGAAERFGVEPDLAVYGKALAGGWPVSAIAGRRELMSPIGTGRVNHSGTFNASVMACAAVSATLDVLRSDPPYQRVAEYGTQLQAGLRELGERHGVPLHVQGLPMVFHVAFGAGDEVTELAGLSRLDLARYARFAKILAQHGVWVAGRGIWFVSAAHGDRELADTLERVHAALTAELDAGQVTREETR